MAACSTLARLDDVRYNLSVDGVIQNIIKFYEIPHETREIKDDHRSDIAL